MGAERSWERAASAFRPHICITVTHMLSRHSCDCNSAGRETSAACVPRHWWTTEENCGDSHWLTSHLLLTQSPVPQLTKSPRRVRTWLYNRHLSHFYSFPPSLSPPHSWIPVVSSSCQCKWGNNWSQLPRRSLFSMRKPQWTTSASYRSLENWPEAMRFKSSPCFLCVLLHIPSPQLPPSLTPN